MRFTFWSMTNNTNKSLYFTRNVHLAFLLSSILSVYNLLGTPIGNLIGGLPPGCGPRSPGPPLGGGGPWGGPPPGPCGGGPMRDWPWKLFINPGLGGIPGGGMPGWCCGGPDIWCRNPGGLIPGGRGPPGMGPPGIGPPCSGPVGADDIATGGGCMLGIKGMGPRWGWLPGACICNGGPLTIVGGLDEGRLGVLGAYLGSDALRSSC